MRFLDHSVATHNSNFVEYFAASHKSMLTQDFLLKDVDLWFQTLSEKLCKLHFELRNAT